MPAQTTDLGVGLLTPTTSKILSGDLGLQPTARSCLDRQRLG
jgi:hypothetical protein